MIETYYFAKERLEWNFSLGPMWNKGNINIDAIVDIMEWKNIWDGFGTHNVSSSVIVSDNMTSSWFGFASFIGLRYYVKPWWAVDIKAGFITNYYDDKNWKFQGSTVPGLSMTVDGLPIITLKFIFGW